MSLNHLSLSRQLLADLYGTVLVQGAATPKALPFLGANEKNILILVNKKDAAFLPDKELDFLTQVLSACGLGLSHVAIVNVDSIKNKQAAPLLQQFGPKQVLFLDVAPDSFGFPPSASYAINQFGDLPYVSTPSLYAIEKSKDEKRGLWTALKQLFCI